MKTYEEMVLFIAEQSKDRLRYFEWPAALAIAEAYGVAPDTVFSDIKVEKDLQEQARKEGHRAKNRADHEARRLANLAKKETQ